jgi:hypothetical protein
VEPSHLLIDSAPMLSDAILRVVKVLLPPDARDQDGFTMNLAEAQLAIARQLMTKRPEV